MPKPSSSTYPPNFDKYIQLVSEDDINTAFKNQTPEAESFFKAITEQQSLFKYAEEKWTIKEILQHLIDAERIFAYRALAFARKDKSILPSFDENGYAANSHANNRGWEELIVEFLAVRKSIEILFNSFSEEDLNTSGKASNYEITVLALGYITVGHAAHHMNIIRERYLEDLKLKI
ncbi:MAG: DinB family protein [Bacteroidota bacterium]|nr:DinB family protein [Bacteroidota bacterium]